MTSDVSRVSIAVPEEVSMIGHDNSALAKLTIPALTSVGIDSSDILERPVATVVSVCQGGPALEAGPVQLRLVARASTWRDLDYLRALMCTKRLMGSISWSMAALRRLRGFMGEPNNGCGGA